MTGQNHEAQEIYEALKEIYKQINKLHGGIKYIDKVIDFLEDHRNCFIRYWRIRRCAKYHIELIVPTWSQGNVSYCSVDLMSLDKDEEFSIEDVERKVKGKRNEIIGILLRSFAEFLESVLEKREEKKEKEGEEEEDSWSIDEFLGDENL